MMDNNATHKEGRGPRLARREPADHGLLHLGLRLVAEPGRALVRHHRTTSHPARDLHLGPRSDLTSTTGPGLVPRRGVAYEPGLLAWIRTSRRGLPLTTAPPVEPSRWRRSVPRRTDGCPQGHFGAERGL